MAASTVITDTAGIATALGVVFGAGQLLLSRSQATTTFEDGLSVQYRQMFGPRLADELLGGLSSEERDVVRPYYDYFDLCNEQVFLRMQGRVRRRTWREWQQGIKANLQRGSINAAWLVVQRELKEFDELSLLHKSGYQLDPRTWNPRWRRLLRLELPANDPAIEKRVL